jgi:hypothetical protein
MLPSGRVRLIASKDLLGDRDADHYRLRVMTTATNAGA